MEPQHVKLTHKQNKKSLKYLLDLVCYLIVHIHQLTAIWQVSLTNNTDLSSTITENHWLTHQGWVIVYMRQKTRPP